jgi:hypothetical protein
MQITRTSILSGETRTKDIDVTPEQLEKWSAGEDINSVMSNLSRMDREFVSSGTIEEEWKTFCPLDE